MIRFEPTPFQRIVLTLSAAIAVWIGVKGMTEPQQFLAAMEIEVGTPGARNEIRGQYGGYFIALGLLWLAGAAGLIRTSTALVSLLVLYGGVLSGRAASLAIDGAEAFAAYPGILQRAHALDAVGFLLTSAALAAADRQQSRSPG
ncbi:MAG: DUF4345 domain-containing protein [Pseudomonadota bacterium]